MRIVFLSFFVFSLFRVDAQQGAKYLTQMHKRYAGKWYRTFTFVQTTEFYRNDSLKGKQTWYEAAAFPYDFRIDVGDRKNGNGVIYKKDSTHHFRKGNLAKTEPGTNPFTFLLGGMYAVSLDTAKAVLQRQGYDLAKGYKTTWNGRKTYVIGALAGDTISKQFWVDAKNLYLGRTIEKEGGFHMDSHLSDHVRLAGGWSETRIVMYFNGKLGQVERYADLKANVSLDPMLFEPVHYGKTNF